MVFALLVALAGELVQSLRVGESRNPCEALLAAPLAHASPTPISSRFFQTNRIGLRSHSIKFCSKFRGFLSQVPVGWVGARPNAFTRTHDCWVSCRPRPQPTAAADKNALAA